MYWYVLVHTSMYRYILVHTIMYEFHQRTDLYMPVRTLTYWYIRVHAVPYPFQKSANRSRTRNLVHTSHRVYPCAMGLQISMPVKVTNDVSVYIIWFCQTPCPCTWRQMTNQRRRSRRAAAPSHDIPRPSLDVDLVDAQLRLEAGLGTCNVRPADRRSNQKETVT